MKKSQLRQLIRESIKELVNKPLFEQWGTTGTQGIMASLKHCTCMALPNFCVSLSAQVGDVIYVPFSTSTCGTPLIGASSLTPNHYFIDSFDPGDGAGQSCFYQSPSVVVPVTQGVISTYIVTPPPFCPNNPYINTTTSAGCDPSAPFPPNFNLASWTNTWTSLPNFSNTTNPNQPCNFICQRKNQWTSQLAAGGMGPKQTNMVSCKLEEAEAQYLTHNCATSNANNCP
jgi:hypothetical protein